MCIIRGFSLQKNELWNCWTNMWSVYFIDRHQFAPLLPPLHTREKTHAFLIHLKSCVYYSKKIFSSDNELVYVYVYCIVNIHMHFEMFNMYLLCWLHRGLFLVWGVFLWLQLKICSSGKKNPASLSTLPIPWCSCGNVLKWYECKHDDG